MTTLTREQYSDILSRQPQFSKYRNQPIVLDGYRFASKKEARRYQELRLAEKAGSIKKLKLQPRYELQPAFERNGKHYRKIEYVADFQYLQNGKIIVEDVKGFFDKVYPIKKKMFLYLHGIICELREIK